MNTMPEHMKQQFLYNAVKSDCPKTFRKWNSFMNTADEDVVHVAKERGNSEILSILLPNSQDIDEKAKMSLHNAILNKTASLFNLVPKSVEFTYNENIDKIKPLLTGTFMSYESLLKEVHVPAVHVGIIEKKKDEWEVCPDYCGQKGTCEKSIIWSK